MDVETIKIEGSVELAPLLELADAIVDIVETGTTLKENGLEVIEDVAPISARVIVNLASAKMKKDSHPEGHCRAGKRVGEIISDWNGVKIDVSENRFSRTARRNRPSSAR